MTRCSQCGWDFTFVQDYRAHYCQQAAAKQTTPQSPKEALPGREKIPFHECYILIEVDDDGEEHASFYSSPAARDKATLDAIWFGGPDECHKEEAEHYLSELREKGFLAFEGDPPLRWRTMSDYMKQSESALAAPKEEQK